jgi:hypothetical protein
VVTAAQPALIRIPHPVQAGPLPATLWILRRLLNIALLLGILWAVPAVVADYPANTTSWVAAILAAIIVVFLVLRIFARIQRNRIPGALGRYGLDEDVRTNVIPTLLADAFDFVVVAAALPYLLSRSDSYGALACTLALFGGGLLGIGVSGTVTELWDRVPRWGRNIAWNLLRTLPLGLLLVHAGIVLAPDPTNSAVAFTWTMIIGAGIVQLISATLRPTGADIRDGLDQAADALTTRTNVAPTLRDRKRSRLLVRVAVVVAIVAALAAFCLVASL